MADFLFVLSRDDNEATTRCFQFAKIAHSKGHGVNVFMIDGGVLWANNERDFTGSWRHYTQIWFERYQINKITTDRKVKVPEPGCLNN